MKGAAGVARRPKNIRTPYEGKQMSQVLAHKRSQVPPQNGGELQAAWPLPAHEDVVLTR